MTERVYVGSELELFEAAKNWKAYLASQITPFLGARVVEVGAGVGATTESLFGPRSKHWVCLEPDPTLAGRIRAKVASGAIASGCEVVVGVLDDLPVDDKFDTVLYVDVLEHIEDDRAEVARAFARLARGGSLVVLAPAHQWLFTPFDEAIGHYRRYTKRSLDALMPPRAERRALRYLDAVGMLASTGNRLLLKQSSPSPAQIALWDRALVTASRVVDPLLAYRIGKSVLGVWRRTE
jgi:SAM-dependent methyltransferase